jgi:two-component system, chemotaxis family, protein-glutamate methylesterase/glutaminase
MNRSRPGYDVVVMAASLGGLDALKGVLGMLPADFPVPVAVVQHRSTRRPHLLATLLGRWTPLRVKMAEEGEQLRPGTVYLAPPGHHMSIHGAGLCHLSTGQKIQYLQSSANPLFTSAADAFEERVVAVVLTGGGRDATEGVQSIKAHQGFVIVQDEATSEAFSMPHSAIETGCVDRVLPLEEIGPALVRLVQTGSLG